MHGSGVLGDQINNTLFNGQMKNNKKDHGTQKNLGNKSEYIGEFD